MLLVDEIDSLIGDTLLSVLRQLRAGYEQRPRARRSAAAAGAMQLEARAGRTAARWSSGRCSVLMIASGVIGGGQVRATHPNPARGNEVGKILPALIMQGDWLGKAQSHTVVVLPLASDGPREDGGADAGRSLAGIEVGRRMQ